MPLTIMYGLSTSLCLTHTLNKLTHNGQTLSLAAESPIKHLNAVTHSVFFFFLEMTTFIHQAERNFTQRPHSALPGSVWPVNWLLLTNKDVKSSIVHLFLYANEVQTQHALSFVSSPHPPSSLSLSDRRFWCEECYDRLALFLSLQLARKMW